MVRLARPARETKSKTFGTKGVSSIVVLVTEISGVAVGATSDEAGTDVRGLPDSGNSILGKLRASRGQEKRLGVKQRSGAFARHVLRQKRVDLDVVQSVKWDWKYMPGTGMVVRIPLRQYGHEYVSRRHAAVLGTLPSFSIFAFRAYHLIS